MTAVAMVLSRFQQDVATSLFCLALGLFWLRLRTPKGGSEEYVRGLRIAALWVAIPVGVAFAVAAIWTLAFGS